MILQMIILSLFCWVGGLVGIIAGEILCGLYSRFRYERFAKEHDRQWEDAETNGWSPETHKLVDPVVFARVTGASIPEGLLRRSPYYLP